MIDYQGKAVSGGLHAHLAASGIAIIEADGVPVVIGGTDAAAQAAIETYGVSGERSWLKDQVVRIAKAKRDAVVEAYSAGEMAAWAIKEREAGAYVDEDSAPALCPMLHAEAAARFCTVAAVKARVLANAAAFRAVEAAIAGHAGYLRDQIDAATSISAVAAIDIHSGWVV